MTISDAVALRIEEILNEHKMTQYKLSQLSGVSQATISDIRLKKNKSVNLRVIYELMDGINMSLKDFFNSPLFDKDNIVD